MRTWWAWTSALALVGTSCVGGGATGGAGDPGGVLDGFAEGPDIPDGPRVDAEVVESFAGDEPIPDPDHPEAAVDEPVAPDAAEPPDAERIDPDAIPDAGGGADGVLDSDVLDAEMSGEAPPEPPPLFDLAAIRDATTAQCDFHDHRTVWQGLQIMDVWRLSYWSWESVDGVLRPIRIRAFAARPAGGSTLPGVVTAHGLGGFAEESHALGHAALLGMFVIAYTGPGGGKPDDPDTQSEGLPAGDATTGSFYRLFDTVPDPRGSWMWGHAVAAMRAVTCLQTRDDVDPDRLGITGGSAGAMVSLIASGVDDRIRAAVPFSGTGAFDIAIQAPAAWQHALLSASGLTTDSPQWAAFLAHVDPIRHVPGTTAAILMVNGSCDEFFPLTAHLATYEAIPAGLEHRTSIVANFDHGCYSTTAIEPANTIDERVNVRFPGNERAWFQHHFGTNATYAHFPSEPVVQVEGAGANTLVAALPDLGTGAYGVERVWYWFSNDDAYNFLAVEMEDQGGGLYGAVVPAPLQDNTVYYVDVQYKTKSFIAPERFAISSPPRIPAGFVPRIRQWGTCL